MFLILIFFPSRYPFSVDQDVPQADWEVYLRDTANAIVNQQNPQRYEKGAGEFRLADI